MFRKKSTVTKFKFILQDDSPPIKYVPFFDMEGNEISCGFVNYDKERVDEVVPEYSFVNNKEIQATKLRVDKRTVPAKLLNKEFEKALKQLIKDRTTVDEYGEVDEYIPSKDAKKELKAAIKNRLLRETNAVPNYYDVILCSDLGYGYISSTSKKDIECLMNCLGGIGELYPFIDDIDDLYEDDFSYFVEDIYKQDKDYDIQIEESAKLKDSSDDGNVSFTNSLYQEQVDKLLELGYIFIEADLSFKDADVTFKMKNWENIFAFEDEAMEVEEEEKQEEISQRWIALESLYKVLGENIKKFLEN